MELIEIINWINGNNEFQNLRKNRVIGYLI